ncbi:MAG: allantoinase, partial [Pseudomonadota bacterium]
DDLPYWNKDYGKPLLIIPYALDSNDFRFALPQGFNSGDQFFTYLADTFNLLYEEGKSAPKMMSVGLHCRISGRPGRAAALARFLDHVRSFDDVWICRRSDIARHWMARFPAERT